MNERSSGLLVGAFVVGALVIGTAGALFVAGGGFGAAKSTVVMVFDGSLRGLNIGAPIALRGVTVGQVTDIDLILDAAHGEVTMAVVGEIDPTTMRLEGEVTESIHDELVSRGLRAQLNTQSLLTGLLYVQLDFHPGTEMNLQEVDSPHPQIPTIPTELEQLRQSLESIDYAEISESIDRIATGLDALLNDPDMQALPTSLRSSVASLEAASKSVTQLVEASTPALVGIIEDGRETVAALNEQIPQIGVRINSSLASLEEALVSANGTLARLEAATAPDSAPRRQISQAVQEISLAARALRSLARSLEEHPEALLRGRGATEQ